MKPAVSSKQPNNAPDQEGRDESRKSYFEVKVKIRAVGHDNGEITSWDSKRMFSYQGRELLEKKILFSDGGWKVQKS